MRVLVTGATGMVGRRLVMRLIERGDTVQVLSRQPFKALPLKKAGVQVIGGDITQARTLPHALAYVEVVYHVAALVGLGLISPPYQLANVTGTANMLKAATAAGVQRFVHVSSIAAYDNPTAQTRENGPITRQHRGNAYSTSKALGDLLAQEAMNQSAMEVVIARPAVVYDTGRDTTDLRYRINYYRRFPVICVRGGGNLGHDVIHADDVARLLVLCGTHPNAPGKAFNASSDEHLTMRQLFTEAQLQPPAILNIPTRLKDASYPADLARSELEYDPMHHWRDPITSTADSSNSAIPQKVWEDDEPAE